MWGCLAFRIMNLIKALKVVFMVEAAILRSKFTASSSPSNASSCLTSVPGGVWFCSLHICCISCSTACGSTQPSAITFKLQMKQISICVRSRDYDFNFYSAVRASVDGYCVLFFNQRKWRDIYLRGRVSSVDNYYRSDIFVVIWGRCTGFFSLCFGLIKREYLTLSTPNHILYIYRTR